MADIALEEQACYIFEAADDGNAQTLSKKRKTASFPKKREIKADSSLFRPLFYGEEDAQCITARYQAYEQAWGTQNRRFEV
jgi:hypothetical protein